MSQERKCKWFQGCSTSLSSYNNSDLCGPHQKEQNELETAAREKAFWNYRIPTSRRKVSRSKKPIEVLIKNTKERLTAEGILTTVCQAYQVTLDELISRNRKATYSSPRQVAMYLLRTDLQMSFPEIGRMLKRDHSNIMHGFRRIEQLLKSDATLTHRVELIRSQYKSPA
ncbi:MAG: hypothetical protein A3C88_02495 [Candidatus Yanofskybacteria bacterium RIFCSPHIGHO2_02_FULL_50_12]|uniref:Chromosomal replication initiator DnaA C-terminal domain-containing protein n=1 Tax=Candidatus Yanofskybacteria bacterium RIFCSPHIGHO2_02_FULL_50_12 TaxID=1802685 RepID=A0A1F8FV53_9BACT|nr:MAG: hypothetical protein A3C88_02495 [Candidatus Yanofskybacteria bacterium RIFCSPHIGHO2_02_FULL_50_12]